MGGLSSTHDEAKANLALSQGPEIIELKAQFLVDLSFIQRYDKLFLFMTISNRIGYLIGEF